MKTPRLLLAFLLAAPLAAYPQIISNFVGGGGNPDGVAATGLLLSRPGALAVDGAGNLYVADTDGSRVYRVDAATQKAYVAAGGPAQPGLGSPTDIGLDAAGNLFIADAPSFAIRRVDAATHAMTNIGPSFLGYPSAITVDDAGAKVFWSGTAPFVSQITVATGSSDAVTALYSGYFVMHMRHAGGFLYLSDPVHNQVSKYSLATSTVTPIAGTGTAGFSGDGGIATSAALNGPGAIAIDAAGNVYIADSGNARVRRVDVATGKIDTIAGGGTGGDGPALAASVAPAGIAAFGSRVYISESSGRVRKIEGGVISPYAGGGGGSASSLELLSSYVSGTQHPFVFDGSGNAYVIDRFVVRRIDAITGMATVVAGNATSNCPCVDGGPATQATIFLSGIAVDAAGNLYLSDSNLQTIRRVDAVTGIVSRYAGSTYAQAPDGDGGLATNAHLGSGVGGVAFDPAGNLYVSAAGRVRKIDKATGIITTVLGAGADIDPQDGTPAGAVGFGVGLPPAIAFDAAGNLYFRGPRTFRLDAATGLVRRIGPAGGVGLAVDGGGNVYYTWSDNSNAWQVRRVSAADGSVTTVAGTGRNRILDGEGGPFATTANLMTAGELAFGPGGHLYVVDGSRIRKVTMEGISAWPIALDFAGRLPQTTSPPAAVTLTNLAPSAATITSITVPAGFAVAQDCGASLAAGASCTANVTYTPAAVENVTGTLDVTASSAVVQDVPLTGAGETSLVTFYYETIMRREPDSGGKAYWDGERTRMQSLGANVNETWFAMSGYFFTSSEYRGFQRNATDFLTDLYKTFFDRAPDPIGQQFWIDQMAGGMPREVVLAQFQLSSEFTAFTKGIFGDTAARPEVDMVMDFYRGLLHRLPDTDGFNHWVKAFRDAQCQPTGAAAAVATLAESISEGFATSYEYGALVRDDGQYVGDLYNAFLRRGGELSGVKAWITALGDGTYTRKQERDEFRKTDEFKGRVSSIAGAGCIQ